MIHRLIPWIAAAIAAVIFASAIWHSKAAAEVPARVQRWLPDVARHVETIWQHKRHVALHGALIERESGGRPDVSSPAGATGLVQIMPGTLAELRQQHPGFGSDPRNPNTSMALGFRYLHRIHGMHASVEPCERWKRALAGYNAGPYGALKRIRRHGENWLAHMPRETRHYVPAILGREPVFLRHGWPGEQTCAA